MYDPETEVNEIPAMLRYTKKKFLIDIRSDRLQDNDYRTAKIEKLIRPLEFGMENTFFGGNVYTVAKLKNKKYYLLVNQYHKTIGICMRTEDLDSLSKPELLEWARMQNIKMDNKDSKEDIINKLV